MYPSTSTRYDDKTWKDHAADLGLAVLIAVGILLGFLLLAAVLEPPHYAHAYVQITGDRGGKFRW